MSTYLIADKSKGIPTFGTEVPLKTEADLRMSAAFTADSLVKDSNQG